MSNIKNDDGYELKQGEGIKINFKGTKMTLKVSGSDSEGNYSLIEMIHPPNTGPALHIHSNATEAYYFLDGNYFIRCGKREYQAYPGDFVFIPKGISHNYQSGPKGGKVLVISPAGLEGYFKEVADILVSQDKKITWNQEVEIAKRYGQEFLESLKHWT
ncbi:MAG: cupin domain-containing protein [Candidatus Nitrosocosmicus sp.]